LPKLNTISKKENENIELKRKIDSASRTKNKNLLLYFITTIAFELPYSFISFGQKQKRKN
jgi:competence transcription factor ComK